MSLRFIGSFWLLDERNATIDRELDELVRAVAHPAYDNASPRRGKYIVFYNILNIICIKSPLLLIANDYDCSVVVPFLPV